MVAQVRTISQGASSPPTAGGWSESAVKPLKLAEIQMLMESSQLRGSPLLIYTILLLHADQLGNVHGHITAVSRAAGLGVESSRHILRRLRQSGLITVRRRSSGRTTSSWWHISAVG